jgi:hypothetical protein
MNRILFLVSALSIAACDGNNSKNVDAAGNEEVYRCVEQCCPDHIKTGSGNWEKTCEKGDFGKLLKQTGIEGAFLTISGDTIQIPSGAYMGVLFGEYDGKARYLTEDCEYWCQKYH